MRADSPTTATNGARENAIWAGLTGGLCVDMAMKAPEAYALPQAIARASSNASGKRRVQFGGRAGRDAGGRDIETAVDLVADLHRARPVAVARDRHVGAERCGHRRRHAAHRAGAAENQHALAAQLRAVLLLQMAFDERDERGCR